jgi:hypothetical protein
MNGRLSRIWLWVKDPTHSSAIMAVFTAVIMLTGIVYTIVAALQWSAMRESNTINRTIVEAARSAAKKEEETTYLANRPRLKILGMTADQMIVNGRLQTQMDNGRLRVRIDVPNSGRFPARNVRFFRFDNVSTRDRITKLPYKELLGEPKLIPPKAEGGWSSLIIITGDTPITLDELNALKTGTMWATFSILVTYDDDFGRQAHHAEYCGIFTLKPYNDICPWPVRND